MKYKAVFFDRDGTLTHSNTKNAEEADALIRSWGGKPYALSYDEWIELRDIAGGGKEPRNVDEEIIFQKKFYALKLERCGVNRNRDEYAEIIHNATWLKNRIVFPETIEVLEYFKSRNYRMGVISDTTPSLRLTLEALGIGKYFTSFTASSVVGEMKPSPVIFNAALSAENVLAEESLYVDDYDVEADGARELGFTSFLIDRENKHSGKWVIRTLRDMVDFAERHDG